MKRAFDILFAVCFLVVFSPVYLLTYIIIKIVSPGPAFYKAKRVGLHGKVFDCYKFRSMRVDSGKVKLTTLQNDDRIFPFGKFIRKAKIDEMPQTLNILFGDMSVVGPRPEDTVNADKMYQGEYKHILDVKPGLTSPASLYDYTHGEEYEDEELYEREFVPQKLQLEMYYVKHQSFWYDIKLILKTAWLIVLKTCGKRDFDVPKELSL
jgi:putative colanic acid biosynthesis UDP-glucose lipid carrier transferase